MKDRKRIFFKFVKIAILTFASFLLRVCVCVFMRKEFSFHITCKVLKKTERENKTLKRENIFNL